MDLAWLKRFRHKGAAHAPEAFELHTFDATKSPPDCRVGAGPEDVDAYFVDGHPPVTESCRDDVAAYEFDGALRVFYAFRPAYAAGKVPAVLAHLGLDQGHARVQVHCHLLSSRVFC